MAIQNSYKIPILVYSKAVCYRQKHILKKGEGVISTKQHFSYKRLCSKTEQIRIKHLKLIINLRYLVSDKLNEVII